MKTVIYPGSFSPWHEGHTDVVEKALQVFDHVIIAQGRNPSKEQRNLDIHCLPSHIANDKRIMVVSYENLLADFIKSINTPVHAVVKGLRNGRDLEYEQTQQFWNEKLGITIPTVYFVATGDLVYVSSSALRAIERFK